MRTVPPPWFHKNLQARDVLHQRVYFLQWLLPARDHFEWDHKTSWNQFDRFRYPWNYRFRIKVANRMEVPKNLGLALLLKLRVRYCSLLRP